MNGNQQRLTELRRLFEHPAGERTLAHECEHEGCDTLTLGSDFCRKHRTLARAQAVGAICAPRELEELRPC